MKCNQYQEQIDSYLNEELAGEELNNLEQHLQTCTGCKESLESSRQLWTLMGEITVPAVSDNMPVRFQAMMDNYKGSLHEKKNIFQEWKDRLKQLWSLQPRMQLGYSLVLIAAGVTIGFFLNRQGMEGHREIAQLSSQVHEMKEMMMLSLLENPSASERIKGVSYTTEIKNANDEVINALFTTLNNDPNVNVRLVTLEALSGLAGNAAVREGLVQSIIQQDSPLVQSALADAMLKLQEKRSVKPFQKMLEQKSLDNGIRKKIEKTIHQLI